jgi:predicted Zn-dependent protease
MMKKGSFLLVVVFFMTACSSVLLTGRKQLSLVTDAQVLALSDSSYHSFMSTAVLSGKTAENARVLRVGKKITAAVESYLKAQKMIDRLSSFSWSFNLVKDSSVNAFCMPGGKIVVCEGILPVTLTDAGLAVVLAHEIAHAVAKHANERMSQQMATAGTQTALNSLLSTKEATTQALAQTVLGLGAHDGVMLPYSRAMEYEADRLGLIFMAMAGYDPMEAVHFWTRISTRSNSSMPEFLSTHPSDAKRIAHLKSVMSEALTYYEK